MQDKPFIDRILEYSHPIVFDRYTFITRWEESIYSNKFSLFKILDKNILMTYILLYMLVNIFIIIFKNQLLIVKEYNFKLFYEISLKLLRYIFNQGNIITGVAKEKGRGRGIYYAMQIITKTQSRSLILRI